MVCAPLLASPSSATVRIVVAIGNDVGLPNEEPLRWAQVDAARVADVMVDVGGVAADRARLVLGASPHDVESVLLQVRGQVEETHRRGERAEVFVTYSGHGDGEALHLQGQRLPLKTLLALVDGVGAEATVVILDACRTGQVRSGSVRGASRAPAFDVSLIEAPAPLGRVVMASASDGEVAQESDDLEGAFFTHHVLAGLRGAADDNGDGAVALAELYAYAHARTLSGSFGQAAVQHPELVANLHGQGELVLTRLNRATATIVLDEQLEGRLLIVDDRSGRVLLEVAKARGRALAMAVPPRRLRLLIRQGAALRVAAVDVSRGSRVPVADADFTEAPRLAGRNRGGDVDTTPFGVSVGLAAGTSVALPQAWSTALSLHLERRLWDAPAFAGVDVVVGRAASAADVRAFQEDALHAALTIGLEAWTPAGRFMGAVGPSLEVVQQQVDRTDADRLRAAGLSATIHTDTTSVGPGGLARGSWWVPLWGPLAVDVAVVGGVGVHVVDGAVTPTPWGLVACGLGVEL